MDTERNKTSPETGLIGRRLISWPLTLIGLTLACLFVANTVSAWGRHGSDDLEEMKSHAEDFVANALDHLDATEAQTQAIQTIVAATIDDLHGARSDAASVRDELHRLITADPIDRDAIESFRRTQMEHANDMSRILVDRLADIMDILTPEQRQTLEEQIAKHRGRHARHAWGWH